MPKQASGGVHGSFRRSSMALSVHSLGMQRCMASSMWKTQITALFWPSQLSGLSVLVIFHGKMIINRWTLVRSLFVGETLISIVLLWWQMDEGKGEMNIAPAMTHNPPRKRWWRRHFSGAYNLKVCQLCARLMFEGISLQKIWPLAVERWHVWFPEQGIVEALAVSTCPGLVVWVILYRSQYVPMLSHHWTLLKATGPSDRYSNLANHR